ncbi:hypothetical protein Tsubulata_044615 [Turnera subulata]|uniref:CCHC-type domain-containing protein n=1 Tax=Turnera subulata TaxID=218843 RepID=A0A9Q0FV42_9ROSI|nr:hypothetical protein Tsubulata_044615 [Turnera subulata]
MGAQDIELSLKPCSITTDNNQPEGNFGTVVATLLVKTVLIIRVVTNRCFKPRQLQNALKRKWGCKGDVFFTKKGFNNFLVCFEHEAEQGAVFSGAPWSIYGYHVIVRKWPPHLTWEQVDLSRTLFWIQVYGLPIELMTEENAEAIGKSLAGLEEIDSSLENIIGKEIVFRLKVEVDVDFPLVTGFFYKDEKGLRRWVRFRYEGLEEFCYHCRMMGHITTRCSDQDKIVETVKFAEPGRSYGPHLRVAPKVHGVLSMPRSKQSLSSLNQKWNASISAPSGKVEEGSSSRAWVPKRVSQGARMVGMSSQSVRADVFVPSEKIPETMTQTSSSPEVLVDQATLDFIPVPLTSRRWKQMARMRPSEQAVDVGLEDLEADNAIRPVLEAPTQVLESVSPCVGDSDDVIPSDGKAVVASQKPRGEQ